MFANCFLFPLYCTNDNDAQNKMYCVAMISFNLKLTFTVLDTISIDSLLLTS